MLPHVRRTKSQGWKRGLIKSAAMLKVVPPLGVLAQESYFKSVMG